MEKGWKLVTSTRPHLGADSTPEPLMGLYAKTSATAISERGWGCFRNRTGDRGPGLPATFSFSPLNMCGCFAYVYVSGYHVHVWHLWRPEVASDTLELGLQMFVSPIALCVRLSVCVSVCLRQ